MHNIGKSYMTCDSSLGLHQLSTIKAKAWSENEARGIANSISHSLYLPTSEMRVAAPKRYLIPAKQRNVKTLDGTTKPTNFRSQICSNIVRVPGFLALICWLEVPKICRCSWLWFHRSLLILQSLPAARLGEVHQQLHVFQ